MIDQSTTTTDQAKKTPSQDAQGRWYELLSPGQILTGQENGDIHILERPQQAMGVTTTIIQGKKKKKCRGNRKAQRQRRKLRRQEEKQQKKRNVVDTDDDLSGRNGEEEEDAQTSSGQSQPSTRGGTKRKRHELSHNDVRHLSQSLSQLSVSRQQVKKQPTAGAKDDGACHRRTADDVNQLVTGQFESISTTIKNCLRDHQMSATDDRAKRAFDALKELLQKLYSKPTGEKLTRTARRELKVLRSIRRILQNRPDIVIRRTDKCKVFYIGRARDFARTTEEYMSKTEAHQEITTGRCPLADILQAVQTLLSYLLSKNALTKKQCQNISPKLDQLEIAHYHGLPKPHKPGTLLRPIVASMHGPTTALSKFLNDLLAPIFLKVARQTTFVNGIYVVRQLAKYVADGHLTATTKFITADVTDLYTMIPRQGALVALARFCAKHSRWGKIGTLTIDPIMKMARLILDTNCFAYNEKYYRQVRGGAMGSAFTQVLANIYMLEWEQDLIQYQSTKSEIYRR
ncbi:unnamed protein product [Didymodactylos carnosus]|uniref:Reverse transcriptase domain-containing protein n=1 Tax=Didymodactylos carnosus TaxID=1234261 RepID=A0A814ZR46_9BILA|nr:unnamed protein product [Didymodactylos carnosus]CAF1245237.1 unnamed protein product [Didymodactylos carnosus]CAF3810740.1 unnamed protein product [Didymodactylos carnosus]CAF4010917.1 unnamed protein product [Didymodactylos carnosus]